MFLLRTGGNLLLLQRPFSKAFLLAIPALWAEAAPEIVLYASFDGHTLAAGQVYSLPNVFSQPFPRPQVSYTKGLRGQAALLGQGPAGGAQIAYPLDPCVNRERGSLLLWFRRTAAPRENESASSPLSPNLLPEEGGRMMVGITSDSQWHHLACVWDVAQRRHSLLLDGKALVEWKRERRIEGQALRMGDRFACEVDEFYVLDAPMTEVEVRTAFERGREGKLLVSGRFLPQGKESLFPLGHPRSKESRPPLPEGVDWSLQAADEQSLTAVRQRYRLDGLWRIQPVAADDPLPKPAGWWFLLCPGYWKGEGNRLVDDSLVRPTSMTERFVTANAVWLERAFEWAGGQEKNRVRLHFEGIRNSGQAESPSDIYFNGIYLGDLFGWERRSFEITDLLQAEEKNLIQIMNGRPYAQALKAGLTGSVWLEVCPGEDVLLEDTIFIKAAVAEKQIGVDYGLAERGSIRGLHLWCHVQDDADAAASQWLGPVPVKGPGRGLREAWFLWPKPVTWSADQPRLFRLTLQLRSRDRVVDESFPVRFGFRELAIAGGTLVLNGGRLQLRGHFEPGRLPSPGPQGGLRRAKASGFNAGLLGDGAPEEVEEYLDLADQFGWYVQFSIEPSPKELLTGLNAEHARRYFAARMDRLANHPSLVLWQIRGKGAPGGPENHPALLGRAVKPAAGEAAWGAARILNELDPTRPNYYEEGLGGDLLGARQNFGPEIPLQSQEEWPRAWAASRPQPLVLTETDLMQLRSFFLWQRGQDNNVPLFAEHAAKLLGPQIYQKVTGADALTLSRPRRYSENYWVKHPVYGMLLERAIRRVIPAWRAFGVSFFLSHRRLSEETPDEKGDVFMEKALARWNGPVSIFIAGPEENFVVKDHAYFPGEEIRKSVIVTNDSQQPFRIHIEFQWALGRGEGQAISSGKQGLSAGPGQVVSMPLEFKVPEVADKTPLRLAIRADFIASPRDGEASPMEDAIDLQIVPRFQLPETVRSRRFLVADPEGLAEKILESQGVSFVRFSREARLGDYDLFLAGRGAATPELFSALADMGLKDAVEKGLNLILLEQPHGEVLGLRVETFDSREVFIRAPQSALLQGLSDPDFADWRGAAGLKPAYPGLDRLEGAPRGAAAADAADPAASDPSSKNRSWHWSNLGITAMFCYQKPQRGNFNILLENGFDLLYSPLLEFQKGRGRILFCQLDVTDRFGLDPVATLLVQRMLAEYSRKSEVEFHQALFIGGQPGREILGKLGIPCANFFDISEKELNLKQLLIMDLRQSQSLEPRQLLAVQTWVARGGRLLQVGASSAEETQWLPGEIRLQRQTIYSCELPPAAIWQGLGVSDFFWRSPVKLPCIQEVPPRGSKLDSGVLAIVPFGQGQAVFCQADPSAFTDSWQRTKIFRILSTLLTRLGAQSAAGLRWPGDSPEGSLGPYVEEALDFDPESCGNQ